jgi:cation transport ATPase
MVSTLIVCYITIFAKLPKTTGSHATQLSQSQVAERQKTERNLTLQFSVIVVVLIASMLSFTIITQLTLNRWFMLLISVIFIINNACNPFVYLALNSAIRKEFLTMICK